jgi:hypothetical protein
MRMQWLTASARSVQAWVQEIHEADYPGDAGFSCLKVAVAAPIGGHAQLTCSPAVRSFTFRQPIIASTVNRIQDDDSGRGMLLHPLACGAAVTDSNRSILSCAVEDHAVALLLVGWPIWTTISKSS